MYRVRDLMSTRALYVTPEATIESAMGLVRLQQLDLVPVVAEGQVVGILDSLALYRYNGELPVREVMQTPVTVESGAPLGEAAAQMLKHHLRQIPVTEAGRLIGILSYRDLLATWGASTDPLTGLPWQDHMRRWAATHLAAGREVAVLFTDLDRFGLLNKTHGHVTADHVLKAVATALRACIDARRDTLCRYGGDEFVIATTRGQDEAWELAGRAREAVRAIGSEPSGDPQPSSSQGPAAIPVSVSIGLSGGKRRSPRPGDHASATLDDLINWASRASTQAKSEPEGRVAFQGTGPNGPEFVTALPAATESACRFAEPSGERIVVDDYRITQTEESAEATVRLRHRALSYEESASHPGGDRLSAVALATVGCVQKMLVREAQLSDVDVRVLPGAEEPGIAAALLSLSVSGRQERLIGAARLLEDRYRSVINAVLDAVNRRLGVLGRVPPGSGPSAEPLDGQRTARRPPETPPAADTPEVDDTGPPFELSAVSHPRRRPSLKADG
jgi:IMP dehydrogenase